MQVLHKHYLTTATRRLASLLAKALCWTASRSCDHIIAATSTIAEQFPSKKTTIVHNYPKLMDKVDDATPYQERSHSIVYVGGISTSRGIREMLSALEFLPEPWHLTLAGPVNPPTLLDELQEFPGWTRVDFHGRVTPDEARKLVAQARIGFVTLHPTPAYVDALPTKLFEYMAAGIPAVVSDFPLWRDIVESLDCGILVDPNDTSAIAEAAKALIEDPARAEQMGQNGRRAIAGEINWSREKEKLLNVYQSALSKDDSMQA